MRGISDLAHFRLRKYGADVTEEYVTKMVADLTNNSSLVRYKISDRMQNIVYVINGVEVIIHFRVDSPRIEEITAAHPQGMMSNACTRFLATNRVYYDRKQVQEIIRTFESPGVRRVRLDSGLYQGTITFDGDEYIVFLNPKSRQIVRIQAVVLKYATMHAVQRAKQRYHLPLTSSVAAEMVAMMQRGEYTANQAAPGDDRDTIRATIEWDTEEFTIVFDPRDSIIVTLTPLGDYDRRRKLAGA